MHCCKILLDRSLNVMEHPCHRFIPVNLNDEGVDVKILACSMLDESTGYSMVRVLDQSNALKEGTYESEDGECNVTKVGSSNYIALVVNHKCLLSRLINKSGCFLSSAVPRTDTLIEWTILGPSNKRVHQLLNDMKANGYHFEIISSESVNIKSNLTPRQEVCFNMAMDLGYYDVPKRTDLDELSKVLGCSKSTLNVTLRNAEKSIFNYYRSFCDNKVMR